MVERYDNTLLDENGVPYEYGFTADLFFTLRAPIIAAARTVVVGTLRLPDNDFRDYEGGALFSFNATGHRVGDVVEGFASGGGRTPPGAFSGLTADVRREVTLPDGTTATTFVDHVENALFDTTTAPEPATLALVGGGLLALGVVMRRRRQRA